MNVHLNPVITSRLEKAAIDNGFDQDLSRQDDWLVYSSTQCPLRIWLGMSESASILVAFSQQNVSLALREYGDPFSGKLPDGAVRAHSVIDVPRLHQLLRRAFHLSRTLPDELLHIFREKTAKYPQSTEVERLVVQRVGQAIFRSGLIEYWNGSCSITSLAFPALLRASHIKPWADCENDAERLDIFNGLLLAPNVDAAFDGGFITIDENGSILVSDTLPIDARLILGLNMPLKISGLCDAHLPYLNWHRTKVFR